jgi:hypothetical protein
MRKSGVLLIILLFSFIFLQFISAQDLEGIQREAEKIQDLAGKSQEFTEKEKWEYIGEQIRNEILLKNKFIAFVDNFFKKISFVFFILFAKDYIISLTLFFIIILWGFFYYYLEQIFTGFSGLSTKTASGVAFLLTVAFSHIGIHEKIAEFAFKFIFYKEGIWSWLFFAIVLFILFALSVLIHKINEYKKQVRKKLKEQETQLASEFLRKQAGFFKSMWRGITEK